MAKDNKEKKNSKVSLNKDTALESNDAINEKKIKVKKEKKVKKNVESKTIDAFEFIDDNRVPIILFIVGFLLATLLFRYILWPDKIATLKDGTQPVVNLKDGVITADDLYESMKEYYSIKTLLNDIDNKILSEKYPSNDEMEANIKRTADYYFEVYEKNYNYTKEQFLSEYGFNSENDFIDSLRLDYRRNEYYEEYVLSIITDKEIQSYYDSEVFGDVDSKHILVSTGKDGLSNDEAKALANEIIGKLNKGTSWDDVIKEYKEKIIDEELGYNAFNASLESSYLQECKKLAVGTYSKTPVLTSYGYHIVYKIAQKEKPELKDVKDDVKNVIAKQKKDDDENLYYKALIKMREDAELSFEDTKFAKQYKDYIDDYK